MENPTHIIGNEKHIVPQVDEMHSPRPSYETDELGNLSDYNSINKIDDEYNGDEGLRAKRNTGI